MTFTWKSPTSMELTAWMVQPHPAKRKSLPGNLHIWQAMGLAPLATIMMLDYFGMICESRDEQQQRLLFESSRLNFCVEWVYRYRCRSFANPKGRKKGNSVERSRKICRILSSTWRNAWVISSYWHYLSLGSRYILLKKGRLKYGHSVVRLSWLRQRRKIEENM
jgi:hypothetical protein